MGELLSVQVPFAVHDPHSMLGIQEVPGGAVIRLWRPGAEEIHLRVHGAIQTAEKVHSSGLFECPCPKGLSWKDYTVFFNSGFEAHDPYAFARSLSDTDLFLFGKGVHYQLFEVLGANPVIHQGCQGTRFSVWAPNARRVSILADFNNWDGRALLMRNCGDGGVWELFVPGVGPGEKYKFEIETQEGQVLYKTDPMAKAFELRPGTASQVTRTDEFSWMDQDWMEARPSRSLNGPLSVYEVHLGSWRLKEGEHFLNYRELAVQLVSHCRELGFNAVELMPVMEHPLDESWGYQVVGFFAPSSRFGSLSDFQFFVNYLHQHGIAVILDWVPGHFPADDYSLAHFDGTCLYEHEDVRQRVHPHWDTYCFAYGRREVSNFLLASALYWLEVFHVDGLRVDAVASMLYLDYGREEGEWVPNAYGGHINLEAVEFLKHLNSVVHERYPGVWMMAEESTSYPGVTQSLKEGGLGFDLKWNMGWMNDTLSYFSKECIHRAYHQDKLTFGQLYAYSERFMLPLSHDEVVHGKRSLLSKMPGDDFQRFANLRLLVSYQICQPGKKVLFMGGEIGQWVEWNCKKEVEWFLLDYPSHRGIRTCVADLNHLYLQSPALWERDFSYEGFEWVSFSDTENSVVAYVRKGERSQVLCIHNFTPSSHPDYRLPEFPFKQGRLVMNTDDQDYGGSGYEVLDQIVSGGPVAIPGLATLIYEVVDDVSALGLEVSG